MKLVAADLAIECDQMTERLMSAVGIMSTPFEIAETLTQNLAGVKAVLFQAAGKKGVSVTVTGSDTLDSQENYKIKISLQPPEGYLKLDTFYIVDPAQRGSGLGKKGLSNIYDLALKQGDAIKQLRLTADLDHGAAVWAKMGFLARESDFARVQKEARQRLHKLQEDLPEGSKIDSVVFRMTDHLLDSERMKDPRALWALSDMGAVVSHSYDEEGNLSAKPKKLGFMLLEWMTYKAHLDLALDEQVNRLKYSLHKQSGGVQQALTGAQGTDAYQESNNGTRQRPPEYHAV